MCPSANNARIDSPTRQIDAPFAVDRDVEFLPSP